MSRHFSIEWREKISEALRGRRTSPRTEFQPGNKIGPRIRKGQHLSTATEWKRGHLSGKAARLYRGVGQVTVRNDHGQKVRHIKVRNDGPPRYRWMPLARYLWQLQRGPIPTEHCVVHLDGDSMNDDLANLALVSRREWVDLQRKLFPRMEERRCNGSAKSATLRWRIYRERKARNQSQNHEGIGCYAEIR